jgi:hypothetical protein
MWGLWQMIRPVEQVSQSIKKEGEPFGFSLSIVFMVCRLTYHIYNQEGLLHIPKGNGAIITLWM